jgi:hypothetical protein
VCPLEWCICSCGASLCYTCLLSLVTHSADAVRACDRHYPGKVVQTPEVVRVYLGSFWEAPLKLEDNR